MKTRLLCLLFCITLQAKPVVYEAAGRKYEGDLLLKGPKAPLIFLIHDWDGLTDYELKRSQMLGELGYSVFAIDLFGQGIRPMKDTDRRQHTGELMQDREKMRAILDSAFQAAKKAGANTKKAVVIGYCFGGAGVLEWARAGAPLRAFITFHGGLGKPGDQNYSQVKAPVLVFHGSADQAISLDDFAALAKELEQAKVPHEMITYGGAPHAFTVFGSDRYRADADAKSWKRLTEFLKEIFK